MNSLFRLVSVVLFLVFVGACQPRIQPLYVPSDIALPAGLETAPLPVIRDGILDAGLAKSWKMKELEPGVIRGTLNVANKHQAVVDVVYTNQSYDINYVSSRNLLSQGARIHRNYNVWVRQLETSIYNNLGYVATTYKKDHTASAPAAVAPTTTAFDPAGMWNVRTDYVPDASNSSWCPKAANWNFALTLKNGKISQTHYAHRNTLYVSGEMEDDYVDLRFDVPRGGIDWQWTKRFVLDKPDKRFSAISKGGAGGSGCTGTIDVYMKKQA